jgi:hypothetical protein
MEGVKFMSSTQTLDDRELDDTVEIPAIEDDNEGPLCGTPGARTLIRVVYVIGSTLYHEGSHHCCHNHIPDVDDLIPDEADLLRIAIADLYTVTVVVPGQPPAISINMTGQDYGEVDEAEMPDWPASRDQVLVVG